MTVPSRWFRFRLRTLFVAVTALAAALGWELSIVRERYQLWDEWADGTKGSLHRMNCCVPSNPHYCELLKPETAEPPAWRRLLGDKRFDGGTVYRPLTDEEHAMLTRVFPTMTIEVVDDRLWFELPGAPDSFEDENADRREDWPATQASHP